MAAVCFACRDNAKLRMLREAENTVNNDAFEGCDNICSQVAREDRCSHAWMLACTHTTCCLPPQSEANKRNIVSVRSIVKEPSCFRDNYFEETCYLDQGWAEADSGCKQKGP